MKTKRILATILALVMIGCMTVPSFAAEPITVTEDQSTAVEWTTGEYVVNSNIYFDAGLTINGDVTLTINEGCMLTVNGKDGEDGEDGDYGEMGGVGIDVNGSLKIKGAGELYVTGGQSGSSDENCTTIGGVGISISSGSSLSIDSGTLVSKGGEGGHGTDPDEYGASGNGVYNEGTLTVNGGNVDLSSPYNMSCETANIGDGYYGFDGSLIINGGRFDSCGSHGIRGSMNVTDGEVIAYGDDIAYDANNSTFVVSGGKLYFDSDDTKIYIYKGTANITGGLFNVDMSSYLTDAYFCVANTDADTKAAYPYKVVSGCYLDLEEDDNTYLDTQTIEQPYTLTQNGVTEYVDVTKVKLEWTLPEIAASYKIVNTWDPDNMKWVESKDTTALGEKEATFTFTNYSSVKVCAELSFKKSIGNGNSAEIVDSTVLDTVVNDDHSLKSGEVANGATFTHTYTPTASEFNSLSEGTGVYGTYTATLKKPCCVTIEYYASENDADYTTAKYYFVSGATISIDGECIRFDETVVETVYERANNLIFDGWDIGGQSYSYDDITITSDITIEATYDDAT